MKPRSEISFARPSAAKATKTKERADEDAKQVRLNLDVPVRVHARLKVHVAQRRQTIRDYILSLLEADGIANE